MDPTKWRISKACEECRLRKLRCSGDDPCQRCSFRNLTCVYRQKARNRPARKAAAAASAASASSVAASEGPRSGPATSAGSPPAHSPNMHVHSVAATHRASPSCFLQLYYGPSSNFSMLHSIYHQMEGTRLGRQADQDAEEIGPGLDLFNNRRLFFGDLVDINKQPGQGDDNSALLLDHAKCKRYLERYLVTYWNVLPALPKDAFRKRLDQLWDPPTIFSFDSPENIILALAMALGACTLHEESTGELLFQKAKQGAAKLDELVNVHAVQVPIMMMRTYAHYQAENARPNAAYLHMGTAVRKSVAAGLHKSMSSSGSQAQEDTRERETTFWSLYMWETWISLSLGRPSFIPEPSANIPMPDKNTLLHSLVTLSRLMVKCASRIFGPRHESLLPVWNAAVEIRRDLIAFADQQHKDMDMNLVGDAKPGEQGVWQVMISTMYHHTLLLTFAPCLILRAKLRQDAAAPDTLPPWLNTACEYALDAARRLVGYLARACEQNILCREIKYHAFFLEGSCYALAFDMLQDRRSCDRSLPWVRQGLHCLKYVLGGDSTPPWQVSTQILAIGRMIDAAARKFDLDPSLVTTSPYYPGVNGEPGGNWRVDPGSVPMPSPVNAGAAEHGALGVEAPGVQGRPDGMPMDFNWSFDFSEMDMEAFLSIDLTRDFNLNM